MNNRTESNNLSAYTNIKKLPMHQCVESITSESLLQSYIDLLDNRFPNITIGKQNALFASYQLECAFYGEFELVSNCSTLITKLGTYENSSDFTIDIRKYGTLTTVEIVCIITIALINEQYVKMCNKHYSENGNVVNMSIAPYVKLSFTWILRYPTVYHNFDITNTSVIDQLESLDQEYCDYHSLWKSYRMTQESAIFYSNIVASIVAHKDQYSLIHEAFLKKIIAEIHYYSYLKQLVITKYMDYIINNNDSYYSTSYIQTISVIIKDDLKIIRNQLVNTNNALTLLSNRLNDLLMKIVRHYDNYYRNEKIENIKGTALPITSTARHFTQHMKKWADQDLELLSIYSYLNYRMITTYYGLFFDNRAFIRLVDRKIAKPSLFTELHSANFESLFQLNSYNVTVEMIDTSLLLRIPINQLVQESHQKEFQVYTEYIKALNKQNNQVTISGTGILDCLMNLKTETISEPNLMYSYINPNSDNDLSATQIISNIQQLTTSIVNSPQKNNRKEKAHSISMITEKCQNVRNTNVSITIDRIVRSLTGFVSNLINKSIFSHDIVFIYENHLYLHWDFVLGIMWKTITYTNQTKYSIKDSFQFLTTANNTLLDIHGFLNIEPQVSTFLDNECLNISKRMCNRITLTGYLTIDTDYLTALISHTTHRKKQWEFTSQLFGKFSNRRMEELRSYANQLESIVFIDKQTNNEWLLANSSTHIHSDVIRELIGKNVRITYDKQYHQNVLQIINNGIELKYNIRQFLQSAYKSMPYDDVILNEKSYIKEMKNRYNTNVLLQTTPLISLKKEHNVDLYHKRLIAQAPLFRSQKFHRGIVKLHESNQVLKLIGQYVSNEYATTSIMGIYGVITQHTIIIDLFINTDTLSSYVVERISTITQNIARHLETNSINRSFVETLTGNFKKHIILEAEANYNEELKTYFISGLEEQLPSYLKFFNTMQNLTQLTYQNVLLRECNKQID